MYEIFFMYNKNANNIPRPPKIMSHIKRFIMFFLSPDLPIVLGEYVIYKHMTTYEVIDCSFDLLNVYLSLIYACILDYTLVFNQNINQYMYHPFQSFMFLSSIVKMKVFFYTCKYQD